MSEVQTIASDTVQTSGKVLTETVSGKTADGKTVTPNGNETFKTEAFRKIHATILTDIKNLNKARKVTWNDTHGKKGASRIKQLFSNIKHNIRASWIGKKGAMKVSEQLKTDIEKLEKMLKESVIDSDFKADCEAFYNELKGKRLGGYAAVKEKLTALIGNNNANGSLKADIEKFLQGRIPDNGEKFDVGDLAKRFESAFKKVDSEAEKQTEAFKTLLESYESRLPSRKLGNEIKKLFENELRNEACEQTCRNIDAKRAELLEHIEAFANADYGFSGVARMDLGDYFADYSTDGDTDYTVTNANHKAFKHLQEEFQNVFPNGDKDAFASLLGTVSSTESGAVKQLKALVNDAAAAQKKSVKNEKPMPEKSFGFLKELPSCLNRELEDDNPFQSLTDRTLEVFDKSLPGFEKTKEKLKSLCNACQKETEKDFSVFNRLERALEKVEITDDWYVSAADEETAPETVTTERSPSSPRSYV